MKSVKEIIVFIIAVWLSVKISTPLFGINRYLAIFVSMAVWLIVLVKYDDWQQRKKEFEEMKEKVEQLERKSNDEG